MTDSDPAGEQTPPRDERSQLSPKCPDAAGDLIIRPARRGEMPRIRDLIRIFPNELIQSELPRVQSFFVAERAGEIIGCCALRVYSKRLAEVRSLAVHPDHRGQGIAGRLVDACRKRGRERQVRQLLAVTSEPEFFEGHGFTVYPGWKTAMFHDLGPAD